jgi:hypothetical protein
MRGFYNLLRQKPSSLFILLGWSSISIASLMEWSMYLAFVARMQGTVKLNVVSQVNIMLRHGCSRWIWHCCSFSLVSIKWHTFTGKAVHSPCPQSYIILNRSVEARYFFRRQVHQYDVLSWQNLANAVHIDTAKGKKASESSFLLGWPALPIGLLGEEEQWANEGRYNSFPLTLQTW